MTAKLSAGKKLVNAIERALTDGWEFSEGDRLVLAQIESAEDRRAALVALFESETARPSPSAHKAVALAAEVRQLSAQIEKWQAGLLSGTEDPPAKSWQHQKAVNTRWALRNA